MEVMPKQAADLTILAMRAGLVTMLHGDPGIGKSDIVRAIAKKLKLYLIDIRLAQCDPVDLSGFPMIHANGKRARYVPMDIFPLEDTELPFLDPNDESKGRYVGFLIFLDEINSAALAVQAASYKLLLDKTVGQYSLHPKTKIVCAGNLTSSGAIVNRMGTAMQSRLVHLQLGVDPLSWCEDWAVQAGIDHRVVSFITNQPQNLHNFDPKSKTDDFTFACPRTWEFVSKLLSKHKDATGNDSPLQGILPLLVGTVGEGMAMLFKAYSETIMKLPSINDIVSNPQGALLDEEPAMLFAISHMLASYVTPDNLVPVMEYLGRMPGEFATITLQTTLKRDISMLHEEPIQEWAGKMGAEVFSTAA
jgi:hypothetical protein